jgi:hypothetical protein
MRRKDRKEYRNRKKKVGRRNDENVICRFPLRLRLSKPLEQ